MQCISSVAAAVLAIALAPSLALAAPSVTLTTAAFLDDDGGDSLDLDVRLNVSPEWAIWAGGGRSTAASLGSDFDGTAWRAGSGWQGERLGVSLSAQNWNDSDQFEARTLGVDFSVQLPAGVAVGLIARQRDLDVRYTVTTPLGRSASARNAFEGTGYGAEISWADEKWVLFARAVAYDYDDSLNAVRTAIFSPATRSFPRLQALTESMLTRASGTTDREIGISVDRSFARSGLRADLSESRDALTDESVVGASLSFRYTISPRVELEFTAGQADADSAGSSAYGGLSLTVRM